jgi:uncharacterized protein (DUF342 family)
LQFWPWKKSPKLFYQPTTHQVEVVLSRQWCLSQNTFPTSLIKKTIELLDAHKASGEIKSYLVHETRLTEAWRALRDLADEEETFVITCVTGSGIPALEGVTVSAVKGENEPLKTIAYLTIRAPRTVIATWQTEWLEAYITEKLLSVGIKDTPHPGQLESTLLRAAAGESTDQVPLMRRPTIEKIAADGVDKSNFTIVANHTRKEVYVHIHNPWFVRKPHADQQILAALNSAIEKFARARGTDYTIRRKGITSAMHRARTNVEALGIDVPLVVLAGGTFKLGETTRPIGYPGQGRLFIDVTDDKMHAKLVKFDEDIYKDDSFTPDRQWLKAEFDRLGILPAVSTQQTEQALDRVGQKESLEGLEVATGKPPTGGTEPFLFLTYRESPLSLDPANERNKVDMREIQQRTIVKTGALIAEIRFKNPRQPGKNVFNEIIPPLPDEAFEVKTGEGIEAIDGGRFVAQFDGVPAVDGNNLTIAKAYVVNGDVNMRVGNIRFDGPVEVKGSIDSGAIVECTGPLIVEQSILGAKVRCKTTIDVKGSISMGGQGFVIAKELIQAEFIENAKIQCSGDVKAKKAILNSEIISGKSIETIEGTGIVAGGSLTCRDFIKCGNLGFKNGATTEIACGGDFKAELSVRIRKKRVDQILAHQERTKNSLKEINGKSESQMTERLHEMKKKMLAQQLHMKELIEKAQNQLRAAQGKITYDKNAKVLISNLLSTNCRVNMAGNFVQIETDVIGVAILAKKRRGNFIVAINEVDQEGEGTTTAEDQKAS